MIEKLSAEQVLEIIFRAVGKVASEKNLDAILLHLADMGRDLIQADRCTLWLLDRSQNIIWSRVAHGVPKIIVPAGTGFVGYSIEHNEPLIIEDAYTDSRFNPNVDKQTGYRTKAVMVIPIMDTQGQVMGAFQAVNKVSASEKFNALDLQYMTLAASYSGNALESAVLNQEIEQTQKEIIYIMGEIGESRSKETGNHVKRVAEYSKVLALAYGLSEDESELLKMASPMHDIGKVAIPDSILKKEGKLTDEEYNTMKTHTVVGYNLLNKSNRKILQAAAIVSHQHHERWDGRGYPQGLAGEDIHIYGRITSIADVFDALASDRCYKKAWPLDRVLNLLQEERGRQFDPTLVDIFLDHLDELLAIKNNYADEML